MINKAGHWRYSVRFVYLLQTKLYHMPNLDTLLLQLYTSDNLLHLEMPHTVMQRLKQAERQTGNQDHPIYYRRMQL